LRAQYGTGADGATLASPLGINACDFTQAGDGQLDATRDYIRFGLMMFDNDTSSGLGVTTSPLPNGGAVLTGNPFLGQWSYVKSATNPDPLGFGKPLGCATTSEFEVGARHWAAPPWEGRMIQFPTPDGTLYDLARTNDQIQQVLIGTRPYGATPIDGMMEDARDYFWYNDYGPLGTKTGYADPYVDAGCRDQYILLLTDGAPNLNLRPQCDGALCPYPNKAAQIADMMATATAAKQRIKTYVIGFSVNGAGNTTFTNDGFPATYIAPNNNCKSWYKGVTSNGVNPGAMHAICSDPSTAPPTGSTADACCQLSEIAYYGSGPTHDTPPFFAETQADLVLSFGRLVGGITKSATTRTLPGYAPAASISGVGVTGDFVASFIPNANKVWSGEIDRTRSACSGASPTPQTQSTAAGDSFAFNLAKQAAAGKRLFVSVKGTLGTAGATSFIDSARPIRPWATTATDGIAPTLTGGTQVLGTDMTLLTQSNWTEAMNIDDTTCKRSKDPSGATVPALTKADCAKVVWGFTAAHGGSIPVSGYEFNNRCLGTSTSAGTCSVSGTSCTIMSGTCPLPGEICVPQCSALGAIFRSSPQLVGPPNELLRDDTYRAYAQQRRSRRPAMFVATTDGVLHAFKALSSAGSGAYPTFDNFVNDNTEHELWSFVPPAVLPKLAGNYPTGQQILLDGTPAVEDIVWDKSLTATDAPLFHTTLVAGMGAGGGGYYALNVTDVDCQGPSSSSISTAPNGCLPTGSVSVATSYTQVAAASVKGPQFLWQLTDVEAAASGEVAPTTRTSPEPKTWVALFGKQTGNPALATVSVKLGNASLPYQLGVAVLPGGVDGPPVAGGTCPRAINGGASVSFLPATYDQSDNTQPFGPRTSVRQWAAGPCTTTAVPGRNVTIVRADTGEIIRVFGRPQDVPTRLRTGTPSVFTASPFDSPIVGTPAVYPTSVGSVATKIFVADADGTVWRIDVSSTDPANWKVTLFQDLISKDLPGTPPPGTAANSQPIQVPLSLTQDPLGGIVVAAATGDQENITASSTTTNYVMSIQEQRAIDPTTPGRALVKWVLPLTAAERVTGPMTVFDRTMYFATFKPIVPISGSCNTSGGALLWGMDYLTPNGGTVSTMQGGLARWCPIGRVDAVSGACLDPLVRNENPSIAYPTLAGAIVPGVTIRASQSCASFSGTANDPVITGMSSSSFSLFFGATANGGGGAATGTPQAARPTSPLTRPLPRTSANIDSWALVVD
jgi:type IV pilus assembly protein PilY1